MWEGLIQSFAVLHLSLADPEGATGERPPPQWDPILLFSHTFLPKSTHVGCQCPHGVGTPQRPMGNPGSTPASYPCGGVG